ncbi:trypsin-5-like [Schistocerca cancellata]|uniref:trypsin-5-like n=1 Tax=Schistocerca cancellata TaxID=274614 RepID=UPI0021193BD9|nr:trypsin-5-like [Schistocerca cancellata]
MEKRHQMKAGTHAQCPSDRLGAHSFRILRATVLVWLSSRLHVTVCFAPPRILGGEETSIEEFPYMAGLERWSVFECAATIIRKSWAMTAKHCIERTETDGEVTLRVGTSDRESGGYVIGVDKIVSHSIADIAVLHVQLEFPMGQKVQVVTLGTGSLDVDTVGTVVGWGLSGVHPSPKRMRKTTMVVVPLVKCYPRGLEEQLNSFYCMRSQHEGTGVCRGDSGGPFVVDNMQHGILCSGDCTGQIWERYTFTNPVSFRDWIASVIDSSLES